MLHQQHPLSEWKNHYQDLVTSLDLQSPENKGRKHPRLTMDSGAEISLRTGREISHVRDISPGGMAFYSKIPFMVGSEMVITLENAFNVLSKVVYCNSREDSGEKIARGYRIGTKFLREEDGYRIAVLAMEAHNHKLAAVNS